MVLESVAEAPSPLLKKNTRLLRGVRAATYCPAVVSSRNRYAPNYVYIDKPPGLAGSAWWLASIALTASQIVCGPRWARRMEELAGTGAPCVMRRRTLA
jgi:hypothetical protein